jgi:hypothetical protein
MTPTVFVTGGWAAGVQGDTVILRLSASTPGDARNLYELLRGALNGDGVTLQAPLPEIEARTVLTVDEWAAFRARFPHLCKKKHRHPDKSIRRYPANALQLLHGGE